MCLALRPEVQEAPNQANSLITENVHTILRDFLRRQTVQPQEKLSFKFRLHFSVNIAKIISGEDLAKIAYLNLILVNPSASKERKRAASLIGLMLLENISKEGTLLQNIDTTSLDEACRLQPIPLSESKMDVNKLLTEKKEQQEKMTSPVALRALNEQMQRMRNLLSKKPKHPSQTYRLDSKAQEKYLGAFCPESSRLGKLQTDIIKEILKETSMLSHQEFLALLDKAIAQLLIQLRGDSWTPAGLFTEDKSNLWVLRLALERSPQLQNQMELDQGKTRNLVFWDDGVYSGTQMSRYVSEKMTTRYNVYVVAPLISMQGLQKIRSITPDVHFIYGQLLEPMSVKSKSFVSKVHELKQMFPNVPVKYLVDDLYPIILSHKMPDFLSSYPAIYSGFIPALNPKIVPDELKACPRREKPQLIPYLSGCENMFQGFFQRQPPTGDHQFEWQFSDDECPLRPYSK